MDQKEVWENIAEDWNKKRVNPVPDTIGFLKNKKGLILDSGCGSGRNFLNVDGLIIGTDFSEKMLRLARSRVKKENLNAVLIQSDVLNLPFKDNSFDSIFLSSILHCVKWNKRKKALEELKRVAKKGAYIFISVWNKDQPRFAHAKKESYVPWMSRGKTYQRYYYLYSKDELESLMKKYFKNVKVLYSKERAFKKYPKNIIALARVAKSGQRRKDI